ncbi:daunorubicin biosynthesis sensory transduction protein DnrJ [Geobacter sp. OR-1]|uniref:DegT/DnrJ/EryC1/StrS family aminotransferase n=1 Tax=Geobacter sp. OR-1 TaxID=1266765 RepID=UPI000543B542|nr:DegT/DnrJ/EryC1/StrS family aminotransferase [Geobacter sp. OR-1]GAM09065.1 daunorubicin biosynthesis sensory transduction protein DnrJ [Geobacter sp. OR-1]
MRFFTSGRLILGDCVAGFEKNFAGYCGAVFGVGVNSGTDALFLALKALEIGPGYEVITVSNTAIPTVAAIRAAGGVPVFVDVEPDTFLMDVTQVEAAISPRTRCILPVHLCGQAVDMAPLLAIAHDRGIPLVEDCAQAAGAIYHGRKVGSFGTIGAFSFYPTKVLGAFGDGGMMVTSDAALDRRLRRLRFYGIDDNYHAEEEGYNSRLDEIQAALLDARLTNLDREVDRRREIAAAYDAGLSGAGDIGLPAEREGRRHQYYLYTIRTSRRDALKAYLADCGIETRINYPTPIHLMRGYRFLGYAQGSLPVTERLSVEILSLPMYPQLTDAEVARVVAAVRSFFNA